MKSSVNVYSKNRTALYYSIQYNHFSIFIIQSVGEPLSDILICHVTKKENVSTRQLVIWNYGELYVVLRSVMSLACLVWGGGGYPNTVYFRLSVLRRAYMTDLV